MLHFVYELVDPRTNTTTYVGITDDPNQRFKEHLRGNGANDAKKIWVKQLQLEHLEPRMKILEFVETREEALEREKHWIQQYLQQGVLLLNMRHSAASHQMQAIDNVSRGVVGLPQPNALLTEVTTQRARTFLGEKEKFVGFIQHDATCVFPRRYTAVHSHGFSWDVECRTTTCGQKTITPMIFSSSQEALLFCAEQNACAEAEIDQN